MMIRSTTPLRCFSLLCIETNHNSLWLNRTMLVEESLPDLLQESVLSLE